MILIRIASEGIIPISGDSLVCCVGEMRFGKTQIRIFGTLFRNPKIRAIQEPGSVTLPIGLDYTMISMHGQIDWTVYHPFAL